MCWVTACQGIKLLSEKMFEKIISVQRGHRVSISSRSMHVLNDPLHWMIIEDENEKWNFESRKVEVGKSKKNLKSKNVRKNYKCPNGSPSQHLALVCMYWMTHCIEWSLKMKIKNEISKMEKLKSEKHKKI